MGTVMYNVYYNTFKVVGAANMSVDFLIFFLITC